MNRSSVGVYSRFAAVRVGAFAVTLVAGAALAQPAGQQPDNQPRAVFAIEHRGLSSLLVDDKDAALKRALELVPVRLSELPNEFETAKVEDVAALTILVKHAAAPTRLALAYAGGPTFGGAFGYGGILSFATDEAGVLGLNILTQAALAQQPLESPPEPSDRFPGMREFWLPGGLVTLGPRAVGDDWRYELMFGTVPDPDALFAGLPSSLAGLENPAVRGTFDFRALDSAAAYVKAFGGNNPEVRSLLKLLEQGGLYGADALHGEFALGFTPEHAEGRVVVRGAQKVAERWGVPQAGLTPKELAMVPSDATFAMLWRSDLTLLSGALQMASTQDPNVAYALRVLAEETGVELRKDVLDSLGGTMGFYMSDATGGGSPLSTVLIIGIKDRERLLASQDKLVERVHAEVDRSEDPNLRQRIRIHAWSDASREAVGGVPTFGLRVHGLPMPLEPTYAVLDQWIIAGLTPQSVIAAVQQAQGKGDAGLASRPEFADSFDAPGPLVLAMAHDVRRTMGAGYPWISMTGSAISNAVTSREGERNQGVIVPTFRELAQNAKPQTMIGYWANDGSLVVRTRADRSMLVNACATTGLALQVMPGVAIPAAIAEIESLQKQVEDAEMRAQVGAEVDESDASDEE
ncbi:MAG: hypothetical protein SFZ23_10905 [Planctomycetota bacterium]|nr:hypothetical protein [Planctomycetota bacterium]